MLFSSIKRILLAEGMGFRPMDRVVSTISRFTVGPFKSLRHPSAKLSGQQFGF